MYLLIRRVLLIACCAASVCLFSPAGKAEFFKPTWKSTYQTIQKDFPKARQIDQDQFVTLYVNTEKKYMLLDIREAAEFRVSHLHNAILASDANVAMAVLKHTPKDTPIIVYCSVGYRSSAVAEKLQTAGFKDVKNLKGGIFHWANNNRPVYQGKQLTNKVHPYDRYWSALLQRR